MPKAAKKKGNGQKHVETQPIPLSEQGQPVPVGVDPENPHNLPVVYEELNLTRYDSKSPYGPLTPALIHTLLGWKTEEEYVAEMMAAEPQSKKEQWEFGEDFHCIDNYGRKVRCLNNSGNRPFEIGWAKDLGQMALNAQWAGPLTIPGKHITVNCETIRISRFGRVISGQHEMTGAYLANEALQKLRATNREEADRRWPFWADKPEVVIEVVVATGMTEDERVLRTVDYVKPRSVADMLFTMDLYRREKPAARKELTRMLATALDNLWERAGTRGYKTHPEICGFLERHRKLLECVTHLFIVNTANPMKECGGCGGTGGETATCAKCGGKGQVPAGNGRKISKLELSPGQCAAILYLQGSSGKKTDGAGYRNEMPPSEDHLDWSYWERACDFWTNLAEHSDFRAVRTALNLLVVSTPDSDDNQGLGGRGPEKLALLGHAWEAYKDHDDFTGPAFKEADLGQGRCLCLSYDDHDQNGKKLPEGQVRLIDIADFGGIDTGPTGRRTQKEATAPPEPEITYSEDEMEAAREEQRRRRAGKS